jgi:formate dehydrogenase
MLASRFARRFAGVRAPFARTFTATAAAQDKVLLVLYEGGENPSPDVLGCVQNELGIRNFVEGRGHELIVTSDKDGSGSVVEQHLPTADIVISQPFWPCYLTPERLTMAQNLKLAITAGVGSDHVDLGAAAEKGITVAEVTGSNVVSVAEHVVMQILCLVRNFVGGYQDIVNGGWNIAKVAEREWDLEGKHVGTVAAGRIGHRVLQRLKPFDCHLHYCDYQRLPAEEEELLGVKYHESVEDMVKECDVVTINCPLHPGTEYLFDKELIAQCKPGAFIVNTARGKIVDAQAMADACESGHIAGYAGDVWFPQPAPKDHPWRTMKNHAMTPHVSGTSIDAQKRYAQGVQEILECFWDSKPMRPEYLILDKGDLVTAAYKPGGATSGAL